MVRKYTNNYITTLVTGISSGALSMVATSVGLLPVIGGSDYCYLTLQQGGNMEIVKATSNSGTTITIVRAQEGTSATAFTAGATISLRPTAASLNDIQTTLTSLTAGITGYTTTATAAGTTTLTVSSTEQQFFTGTTTQTVVMPVTSTLTLGQRFQIINNSTGVVTVQSSGANTIVAMAAATKLTVTVILTSGTTAASWDYVYVPNASLITGSGTLVRNTSPTLVTPALGTVSSGNISACTSTSMVMVTPVLGTPTSGALTNCTSIPVAQATGTLAVTNGGTGVTTSTGSGNNVLSTSPTLVTPVLGTPSSGTLTSCTGLPLTTGVTGILPTANGGVDANPLVNIGGLNFNGSDTYLDTNPLTGITDTKVGSFFALIRCQNASSSEYLINSTSTRLQILRASTGRFQILHENAAGTVILNMNGTSGLLTNAGTYALYASWNLATPGTGRLYVNEVQSNNETTYTDDTCDNTVAEISVGGTTTGTTLFSGDIYTLYLNTDTYIDFDIASNRRKFTDVNGVPRYLGSRGELPTGSQPPLYLAMGDANSWWINRGYGSGNFTRNGTIANTSTSLSGYYTSARKGERVTYRTAETSLTLADHIFYVYTGGSAATWTLPPVAGYWGANVLVKNAGSATVAVQRAGSDNIYSTSSVTSINVTAGTCALLINDGSVWQVIHNI